LELVKNRVEAEVSKKMSHVEKKITQYKLHGFSFYIYVFPFMKIADTRKKIIEKLTHVK